MTDYEEDVNMAMGDSILDINTDDAVEPSVVEAGQEYQVRITGFKKDNDGNIVRTSEKGNRYFIITLDIPKEPTSKGFSHIFSVPTEDMEPKRMNSCKWDLDCFKRAFGLAEINFNTMIGSANIVKSFITGQ